MKVLSLKIPSFWFVNYGILTRSFHPNFDHVAAACVPDQADRTHSREDGHCPLRCARILNIRVSYNSFVPGGGGSFFLFAPVFWRISPKSLKMDQRMVWGWETRVVPLLFYFWTPQLVFWAQISGRQVWGWTTASPVSLFNSTSPKRSGGGGMFSRAESPGLCALITQATRGGLWGFGGLGRLLLYCVYCLYSL